MTVSAIMLPRLTVYAGMTSVAVKDWPHLRNLELADPEFLTTDGIDILLGANVYAAILEVGVRKGNARDPIAQQTTLGWIVSGTVGAQPRSGGCVHISEEQECENSYARTHSRDQDGRYIVQLPVAASLPDLAATRQAALCMLAHMERRFERDV